MAIQVFINGTAREVVQYSLAITAVLGQRATFNCRIVSTSGAYRPQQGHTIDVWEGSTKLWAGSVDEVAEVSITEAGAAAGAFYDLRGITWEQRLDRRYCYDHLNGVPAVYERNFIFTADASTDTLTTTAAHGRTNGDKVRVKAHAQGALCGGLASDIEYFVINAASTTLQLSLTAGGSAVDITSTGTLEQVLVTHRAGEIVLDLLSNFATAEALGTTNVDAGAVVDTIIFEADVQVSQAVAELAELSGFVWWIDEEKELFFKPRSFATAPFSIGTSSANYRSIGVRRTREDKINAVFAQVDWSQIEVLEETFTGDGTTRDFTLAEKVGTLVSVTVNGNDSQAGTYLADDTANWYWQYGSDVLRQDPDDTTLTASDTLVVRYRQFGRNVIAEEDSTDIAATATQESTGSGRYESHFLSTLGQVQAQLQAREIIATKKTIVTEIEYETDQNIEASCVTLRPGQIQTIENSPRGVSSASYLIREVSVSDVGGQWLRFRVKAISGTSLVSAAEFWRAMGGAGRTAVSGGAIGGGTVTPGGTSTLSEITLTANTTITSPTTPAAGKTLYLYVTQGAGPYTITFDSDFNADFNTTLPAKSGAVTAFHFHGRSDSKWWLVSAPFSVKFD